MWLRVVWCEVIIDSFVGMVAGAEWAHYSCLSGDDLLKSTYKKSSCGLKPDDMMVGVGLAGNFGARWQCGGRL